MFYNIAGDDDVGFKFIPPIKPVAHTSTPLFTINIVKSIFTFIIYMVCSTLAAVALYKVCSRLAAIAAFIAWATQWCMDLGTVLAGFTLFSGIVGYATSFWGYVGLLYPILLPLLPSTPVAALAASPVALVPISAFDAKVFAGLLAGIGSLFGYWQTN